MSEQPDTQAGNVRPPNWPPISETVLQAYVDGLLDQDQRDQVKVYLAIHPEEAERVAAYLRLNESLHAQYDPVLEDAVPERFSTLLANSSAPNTNKADRSSPVPSLWLKLGRAIAGLALGRGGGGLLSPAMPFGAWRVPSYLTTVVWLGLGVVLGLGWKMQSEPRDVPPSMVKQAAVAYATYANEEVHPVAVPAGNNANVCASCHALSPAVHSVEMSAGNEAYLVAWLSRRLGINLKAAKLGSQGFSLIGGRLLPGTVGPVAQFMYQDKKGRRLTLYIKAQEPSHDREAVFHFSKDEGVNAYYWIENGTGYVLSGNLEKTALLGVAEAVDRQLNTSAPVMDGFRPVGEMGQIGKGT